VKNISDKSRAKRLALEGRPAFSTFTAKPAGKKLRGAPQRKRRSAGEGFRKPIPKVGPGKAKREARNRAYYALKEWREKKAAVHERDGFQCVERIATFSDNFGNDEPAFMHRCPNRGEIVNGKQTARGLVCEEKSYGHRGHEGRIDRLVTRCKDCDRRLTPLERANHAQGFNNQRRTS
jgi:hypothetical protein